MQRLLHLDLRNLIGSHEQCFLAEGVHKDHPSVSIVAIGWGAGL